MKLQIPKSLSRAAAEFQDARSILAGLETEISTLDARLRAHQEALQASEDLMAQDEPAGLSGASRARQALDVTASKRRSCERRLSEAKSRVAAAGDSLQRAKAEFTDDLTRDLTNFVQQQNAEYLKTFFFALTLSKHLGLRPYHQLSATVLPDMTDRSKNLAHALRLQVDPRAMSFAEEAKEFLTLG